MGVMGFGLRTIRVSARAAARTAASMAMKKVRWVVGMMADRWVVAMVGLRAG